MALVLDVPVYIQVALKRNTWGKVGRIARVTSTKPDELLPGAVVVKIRLRIPEEAFDPLEPSAVVEIPLSLVQQPVEVIAEAADE